MLAVVLDRLLAIFFQNLISILSHLECHVQIVWVVLQSHNRLSVLDLDPFCHCIQDTCCIVADWALRDHIHINQDCIDLMLISPAVLLCAFRCVHNAHRGERCAGRHGSRDIDYAETCRLTNSLCKVHDLAAADADNLITARCKSLISVLFCALVAACSLVNLDYVFQTCFLKSRDQALFDCCKCTRTCNDRSCFTKTLYFLAALL